MQLVLEVEMKKVMLHLDQHKLNRGVSLIQKFGMCQRHDMFPNVTAEQISQTISNKEQERLVVICKNKEVNKDYNL